MDATEIAIVWVVSVVLGCMIGATKGQDSSGFIWPALLGPLGVLIVLALPNLVKEDKERRAQLAAAEQMRLQQAMLEELKALRASNGGQPETPAAAQAPPVIEEDSFIPDSLRPLYGKRRR
jgi:hypothetical protein